MGPPTLILTPNPTAATGLDPADVRATRYSRGFADDLRHVRRELDRLAKNQTKGIVVGPWCSEVGFEVLYWIPFLRWAVSEFDVDPANVTAVSRGGTAPWYDGIAGGYRDVFDAIGVDEFRRRTHERWRDTRTQKQVDVSALDRAVLHGLGIDHLGQVLHPSLMYNLFRHFWRSGEPAVSVFAHSDYTAWRAPEHPLAAELPTEFVAVRFYFRPSFPDTPPNRRLVETIVNGLSERSDVVLLNIGLEVDDHLDFHPGGGHRVLQPLVGVAIEENLGAQSAVVSRARAFVGTYGGLSYLAPFYGRDSVAFASAHERYLPTHVGVARHMATLTGATLTILDERTLALVGLLGTSS
jgi:hypothetical protein